MDQKCVAVQVHGRKGYSLLCEEILEQEDAPAGDQIEVSCSKHQVPALTDKVMPKAVMALFLDKPEAILYTDLPGFYKNVIDPEGQLGIA
jgi:hypothetical protein